MTSGPDMANNLCNHMLVCVVNGCIREKKIFRNDCFFI